jgi:predicted PurR-regulated permease PerM
MPSTTNPPGSGQSEPPVQNRDAPPQDPRRNGKLSLRLSSGPRGFTPTIRREELNGDLPDFWSQAVPISLVGLLVLALGYTLYIVQPVLVPVILAWVVGTILLPLVERFERWKLPRTLAAILSAFGILLILLFTVALLSVPVAFWIGRASELGVLLKEKFGMLSEPLQFFRELGKTISDVTGEGGAAVPGASASSSSIIAGILGTLTPAITQFILFFGALMFYLIYQEEIRKGAVFIFRNRAARLLALRIIADTEENMSIYFGTFTVVNLCLGIVTTGLTYACGLPNPVLWGVLAAVLNYIPYLGPAITTGTLFVAGLLSFTSITPALIAPLAYIAITTVEGQFITPTIVGHRLTMNPFLVFLSIAFWTWLWGPVGAFLAVPLVMTGLVAARHLFPKDRPVLPQ